MSFRRSAVIPCSFQVMCCLAIAIVGLALPAGGQTIATVKVLARPLSIDYTGGLFGYYRMEPYTDRLLGGTEETLPPVAAFLERRREDHRLLVGMGNNFAPEFGAALQLEGKDQCFLRVPVIKEEPYERRLPPVVLYKDDTRFAKMAHCDNVAAFLMYAGYRAVVPGREIFCTLQSGCGRLRWS
jgi:hypothetical protein